MSKRPQRWTPQEDIFLRKHYLSMQYEDIAKHLGRDTNSVKNRKKYLGLKNKNKLAKQEAARKTRNQKTKWSEDDKQFLIANYHVMNKDALIDRLGRTWSSIKTYAFKLGITDTYQTHGLSSHPLFHVWKNMRHRCLNPNNASYSRYGGRSISIYSEWKDDPQAFYDWAIQAGWQDGLQIDRIDNDGNYEPSNCRFVSQQENSQNTSRTKMTPEKVRLLRAMRECGGVTLDELTAMFGISKPTAYGICRGDSWSNVA